MKQSSMVRQAAEEFQRNNYVVALDLYRRLSKSFGERSFRNNILLCENRLRARGRRDCTNLHLKALKIACVMDEFTYHSFEPECELLPLTPAEVVSELETFTPDLLFIESAWRGKDELWNRKIGGLSSELKSALLWCKERGVPTVFWNKEDPIHFETFLTTAQQFDFVFTTDIDCISRYKAALGHERVYLLPFACQPKIHNPIEIYPRKDAFCFAGAYYVRYPERTRDLDNYVDHLSKYKPLEIFDRNFGKDDVNYQFPKSYKSYIVGTLPFNEIDKAYKGYRYSINLNSIKQSQTMFARRVYELLGSNTITVSNFSRGIRLLFGDLVISSDSGSEIIEILSKMDNETEQKLRLAGLRKVMLEHTYGHRLAYIASKALSGIAFNSLPPIVVVAAARSQNDYERILENFSAQQYARKRLVILCSEEDREFKYCDVSDELITTLTPKLGSEMFMSQILDHAAWLATMVPGDYYGPNYLLDLMLAAQYSDAVVVGKQASYKWRAGAIRLFEPRRSYDMTKRLTARSALIRSDIVPRELTLDTWLERSNSHKCKWSGLATDPFNYCLDGWHASDQAMMKNQVNDLSLNTGIPISDILTTAESIPPAEFDDTVAPRWNASKLYQIFGSINNQSIRIEHSLGNLSIQSQLPDGAHEYVYARDDLPLSALPAKVALECYLEASAGLDIQYVFVFYNQNKERLGHAIHSVNCNQRAEWPKGTAFMRFGWRICGSGETLIKTLQWCHRKLESTKLLTRSETLLLTNHYPSYNDLYRNGFVHSRVKAYLSRGVHVDVFRFRLNEATSYYEFKNIDVITGGQNALRKLLEGGRYKRVLVHFLLPEMWEVLRQFTDLHVIIWIHGSEIQPWHRRDYNYQSELERSKAMRESVQRMLFWRGLLNPMPKNLKLVFVSRYFAEEVFEDIGFRVPEESYSIIHNPIDTNLFNYRPKPIDQRKRVLSIRPYASRKYANDLSVQAILKLSDQPCFSDIEFRMIGDGRLFDETLEPIRKFSNVIIERRFLTHPEIAAIHKEYGVFLTPTRMDAQGVSRDEAMSSGLVPISNAVAAIPEFVDENCGILAANDDAEGLAAGIMALYNNPEYFEMLSIGAANRVRRQSDSEIVTLKELAQFMGVVSQ